MFDNDSFSDSSSRLSVCENACERLFPSPDNPRVKLWQTSGSFLFYLTLVLVIGGFFYQRNKSYPYVPPLNNNVAADDFHSSKLSTETQNLLSSLAHGSANCDLLESNDYNMGEGGSESREYLTCKININEASKAELTNLPRIGKNLAARIVEYREQNGDFECVDDLTKVSGIGDKMLALLRPYCFVGEETVLENVDDN